MSNYDKNIASNPSSDFYANKFYKQFQTQQQKGKYGTYNMTSFMFNNPEDKNNTRVFDTIPRQTDIQPKNGLNNTISNFVDFDFPQTLNNGLFDDMYLHITLQNTSATQVASLCSAPFFFNRMLILKNGTTDLTNQIPGDTLWMENCFIQTPFTKKNFHANLGMDTTNLNYIANGTNTIAALASQTYYIRLAFNWSNTYFLRDAIGGITIRLYYSNNINLNTNVLTPAISVTSLFLRLHYLEIDNLEYNALLAQPLIDHKMFKRGNVSQSFAINCQNGVSQQFQINSIVGDTPGLLVYLRTAVPDASPCLYESFLPITSISLTDQNNMSLTNNVVPATSQEMINWGVINTHHDFFNFGYVYLIPFTRDYVNNVNHNKFDGQWRLLQPVTKINVTPGVTQANCTLYIIAYVNAFLRVNPSAQSVAEFSS